MNVVAVRRGVHTVRSNNFQTSLLLKLIGLSNDFSGLNFWLLVSIGVCMWFWMCLCLLYAIFRLIFSTPVHRFVRTHRWLNCGWFYIWYVRADSSLHLILFSLCYNIYIQINIVVIFFVHSDHSIDTTADIEHQTKAQPYWLDRRRPLHSVAHTKFINRHIAI